MSTIPEPEEIHVYSYSELGIYWSIWYKETAGIATPNYVAYRDIPPSPKTFVHELIHLGLFKMGLRDDERHEDLAYGFDTVVVAAAEGADIRPIRMDKVAMLNLMEYKARGVDLEWVVDFAEGPGSSTRYWSRAGGDEVRYILLLLNAVARCIDKGRTPGLYWHKYAVCRETWNRLAELIPADTAPVPTTQTLLTGTITTSARQAPEITQAKPRYGPAPTVAEPAPSVGQPARVEPDLLATPSKARHSEAILRVGNPVPGNVGRFVVRLPTSSMKRLGLKPGDYAEVVGNRTIYVQVWPAFSEDEDRDIVRMDIATMKHAEVEVGEVVKVRKVELKPAQRVILVSAGPGEIDPSYIRSQILFVPIIEGQAIDINFHGRTLSFKVTKVEPDSAGYVSIGTEITIGKASPDSAEKAPLRRTPRWPTADDIISKYRDLKIQYNTATSSLKHWIKSGGFEREPELICSKVTPLVQAILKAIEREGLPNADDETYRYVANYLEMLGITPHLRSHIHKCHGSFPEEAIGVVKRLFPNLFRAQP